MKNLKRALSLVLSAAMMVGMMVMGTGAASFTDVDNSDNVEAIEVLKAVGVMIGDGDSFNPDKNVTRNEMAVVMANLMGLKPSGTTHFTDVPAWASGYVNVCYQYGITSGVSETTFGGDLPLTTVQGALMVMKTLGYFEFDGEFGDDWALATIKRATKIDLFDGMNVGVNENMTRNDVAQLVLNALESKVVIAEEHGGMNVEGNGLTVSQKPTYTYTDVPSGGVSYYGGDDGDQQLAEKLFEGKLAKTTSGQVTDYGFPAAKWTYPTAGDEIGKFSTATVIASWTTGIQDITEGDLYKALAFSTNGTIAVYENGSANSTTTVAKGSTTKNLAAYKGAELTAIDINDDGVADRLCVKYPHLAQVTKVTAATASADRKVDLKVWDRGNNTTTTTIVGYETDEFAKDDYVLVYASGVIDSNATVLANIIEVKAAEVVKGNADGVKVSSGANTAVVLDGVQYPVGGASLALKGLASANVVSNSTFSYDDPYTLLCSNGYVLGAIGKNVAKEINDIVWAVGAEYAIYGEYGAEATKRVQIIRMDGSVEIVKIESASEAALTGAGLWTMTDSDHNGEYTFAAATDTTVTALDNSTYYYGANAINDASLSMKADTKTVTIDAVNTDGNTKAYITDNTRTIYVKNSGSTLKTSIVTGAVKQAVPDNSVVLLSKDTNGNYVVEAIVITNTEKVNSSDDVVYVNNTVKGVNADGNEFEMYNLTTGVKTVVTCKTSDTPSAGFATYTVDSDGLYKFTTYSPTSVNNADGSHAITQAISAYGTLLNEGTSLVDIEAKDAVIINNTTVAANDNLTLDEIAKATALTGFVFVDDEVVTSIVINSITKAP